MLPDFIFGEIIIILLNLKIGIDILLNWVYNNGTNKRCGGFNNDYY